MQVLFTIGTELWYEPQAPGVIMPKDVDQDLYGITP